MTENDPEGFDHADAEPRNHHEEIVEQDAENAEYGAGTDDLPGEYEPDDTAELPEVTEEGET